MRSNITGGTDIFVVLFLLVAALYAGKVYFLKNRLALLPLHARYMDRALSPDDRAEDLLSRMTLREKIGQMALVEKNSISPDQVKAFGIGGILSGGGAAPLNNTQKGWREMITSYISASKQSRTRTPILYGVDANHGQGNVPGAVLFPHMIGLGAAADPTLIMRVARATTAQSKAIGANWIYSPTLDLPRDIRWGRVYEAFSDDPALAGSLAVAYVKGLQGEEVSTGVAATAKHYVGLGSMLWNSSSSDTSSYTIDQGATPAREDKLRAEYLPPFKAVVDAGVSSVMVGLNSWGPTKLSASTYLVTDVLKKELGFKGFVVSDWYGVYEISPDGDKYTSAVQGINAGVDMVMLPYDYKEFIEDVERAVTNGDISRARIDDASRRILQAKFKLGLFDAKEKDSSENINTTEQQTLAREAVARSLVLLKNDDHLLPLSSSVKFIRIMGSGADSLSRQMGGWSIGWQGVDKNKNAFGTTIAAAIKKQAEGKARVEVITDASIDQKEIADVGIAVVSEKPYAEGWGDTPSPRLDPADIAVIEKLRASSKKVVVIIVSGRPLLITNEISKWDAAVAAWLPGSMGEGVADALFGNVSFQGRLPLPWPESLTQLPVSLEKTADGTPPLFGRYYGLTTSPK